MTSRKSHRHLLRPKAHIKFENMQLSTLERCCAAVQRFFSWLRLNEFSLLASLSDLDDLLGKFTICLYQDELPLGWASDVLSGTTRLYRLQRKSAYRKHVPRALANGSQKGASVAAHAAKRVGNCDVRHSPKIAKSCGGYVGGLWRALAGVGNPVAGVAPFSNRKPKKFCHAKGTKRSSDVAELAQVTKCGSRVCDQASEAHTTASAEGFCGELQNS